ncbi:MAG: CDP-glycerol glycerophosphotransferase family protein [Eubacteriales bacterium]|nr:CDP-glycerol glycerophosphotransferase family protein [Eubacteriales bacterium]
MRKHRAITCVIKIGLAFFSLWYALMKLFPVRKKVVFISRQSDSPSVDISLLDMEFKSRGWESVTLCKKIGSGLLGKAGYVFHMFRQAYHIATAKIIILDSYCILVSCMKKRKDLLVVQMWHSVGTMKMAGYSTLDKPEGSKSYIAKAMHMHENYDYVLCAGEGYRSHLAELFNIAPEKIKILPLPRVELLKDENYARNMKASINKEYPDTANGKRNILYAPTFRKLFDEKEKQQEAINQLIDAFDFEHNNLIIKLHPLADISVRDDRCIIPDDRSTFDMIFVADAMISDFSCIIYEAAIRNMPLYFYTFDYDDYTRRRGMYLNYMEEMPGPVKLTAEGIVEALDKPYDMHSLVAFRDKYISRNSYRETAAIADFCEINVKNR